MNLKKIINSNSRFSEIIRFGLVGALATVLQYGFYVVFVHVVGVKAVPSSMISYALIFSSPAISHSTHALMQKKVLDSL